MLIKLFPSLQDALGWILRKGRDGEEENEEEKKEKAGLSQAELETCLLHVGTPGLSLHMGPHSRGLEAKCQSPAETSLGERNQILPDCCWPLGSKAESLPCLGGGYHWLAW